MSSYPADPELRQAHREQVRKSRLERAEQDAWSIVRSIKCQVGNHARLGCQNDGSNCLCDCHDQAANERGGNRE